MTGQNDILNFKNMWAWLCGFPAHDREYYMKHVARLQANWVNNCPLSNKSTETECDGCKMLWDSDRGTLCTDSTSPLYKWKNTGKDRPDDRAYYASHVAALAVRFLKNHPEEVAC